MSSLSAAGIWKVDVRLLQDRVHRVVKLFLPSSQLKSTSNMSISSNLKEESSFKVLLFLIPLALRLRLPSRSLLSCPSSSSPLRSALQYCS